MTTAWFIVSLAVLGGYVCRLDHLSRARDPLWYMGATYAMFVVAVESAAKIAHDAGQWPLVLLAVAATWLAATHFFRPHR